MTEFTVNEDHLTLLRNAYVDWQDCETGAPAIDPKRPYGNSDVTGDIAKLLHPEYADLDDDEAEDWLEANEDRLMKLHADTLTVLQIALSTGAFRAGRYVRADPYGGQWQRAEEQP